MDQGQQQQGQGQGTNQNQEPIVIPSINDVINHGTVVPQGQDFPSGNGQFANPNVTPFNPQEGTDPGNQGQGQEPQGQGQGQGTNGSTQGQQGATDSAVTTNSPIGEGVTDYPFLSGDGSNLSQEDTTIRQNIFAQFGATSMTDGGDLLDAQGKVVLSKANLDIYATTGEVPKDANGNQIRQDGSILFTAESIVPSFIDATRQLVEQEMQMTLLDTEGKPKTYANTVEGNSELIKDVYNNGATNAVAQFLQSNPRLKEYYQHLATGGTEENFEFKPVDYSAIDITKLNREEKVALIKTSLEKQKVQNSKAIMSTVELASDEVINQTAADSLLTLNNLTAKDKADREKAYNDSVEAEKKANTDFWNEINSAIKGNGVKNISIPTNEQQPFFDYLSKAVNSQGLSQEMIDAEGDDMDFKLMVSYLRYKKMNIDDLINIRAKGAKANSLRQRLGSSIPNPVIPNNGTAPVINNGTAPEISINSLIGMQRQQ